MAARRRTLTSNPSISWAVESVERGLAQRIKVKNKELSQWQTQRKEAEVGEEQCLREISEMEMAIAVLRRSLGLDAAPPSTDQLQAIRYRNQTVVKSCVEMLQAKGGRGRVADITKVLIAAGKLRGRSAYSTVIKAMDRDRRFQKVGRGEFELIEPQDLQMN